MTPELKAKIQAAYEHLTEPQGWAKKLAEQFNVSEQEIYDCIDL